MTYDQKHFLSLVHSHIDLAQTALHLGNVFDVEDHLELAKGYLRTALRPPRSTTVVSKQKITKAFSKLSERGHRRES